MVKIVFVGGGHANALVLLGIHQENCELVMINDGPYAYYSGMIPGLIAKQYQEEQLRFDLAGICAKHNCQFISQRAIYVNSQEKYIEIEDHSRISYDYTIIDIGSRNNHITEHIKACTLPTRPLTNLLARLNEIETCDSVAVVGGGCGGIELAFALNTRYPSASIKLIQEGEIIPELSEKVRNLVLKEFRSRNIELVKNKAVNVDHHRVFLQDSQILEASLILWATGAKSHDFPCDLDKDQAGYILVNKAMQSLTSPFVFAAGDCITFEQCPNYPPKAGVFAVRESEVLVRNMKKIIKAGGLECGLEDYEPQKNFLKILNMCNGQAIAIKWSCFAGRLSWKLKNAIDLGFMKKFKIN